MYTACIVFGFRHHIKTMILSKYQEDANEAENDALLVLSLFCFTAKIVCHVYCCSKETF